MWACYCFFLVVFRYYCHGNLRILITSSPLFSVKGADIDLVALFSTIFVLGKVEKTWAPERGYLFNPLNHRRFERKFVTFLYDHKFWLFFFSWCWYPHLLEHWSCELHANFNVNCDYAKKAIAFDQNPNWVSCTGLKKRMVPPFLFISSSVSLIYTLTHFSVFSVITFASEGENGEGRNQILQPREKWGLQPATEPGKEASIAPRCTATCSSMHILYFCLSVGLSWMFHCIFSGFFHRWISWRRNFGMKRVCTELYRGLWLGRLELFLAYLLISLLMSVLAVRVRSIGLWWSDYKPVVCICSIKWLFEP